VRFQDDTWRLASNSAMFGGCAPGKAPQDHQSMLLLALQSAKLAMMHMRILKTSFGTDLSLAVKSLQLHEFLTARA